MQTLHAVLYNRLIDAKLNFLSIGKRKIKLMQENGNG